MEQVLETKIQPPRSTGKVLSRPRISKAILEGLNYRLTIIQAGAGFGKSTALARLAGEFPDIIWYQITEEDRDPLVFMLHLCHAARHAYPEIEGLPLPLLEAWDGSTGLLPTREIIYQFLNALGSGLKQNTLLIFDDVHLVSEVHEIAHILDRIIGLAPQSLHIVVSTRPSFKLPNLSRWRSLGQVQIIDQSILAFTLEEIIELFEQFYNHRLSQDEAEDLFHATEGWAITLQLISQSLSSGAIGSISEAITRTTASMESLFDVLASDVFGRQPAEIQEFLKTTSVLRVMTPEICDHLNEGHESSPHLELLRNQDLFVVDLAENGLRYHPIFQQFLYQQLADAERDALHKKAAVYYQKRNETDAAIFHLCQARDQSEVAALLDTYGGQLKEMGRLDTLAGYLDQLSPEVLHQFPNLLLYMGDLARFHSRFQEALGWYQQAESLWVERGKLDGASRALRGQARVYLDTVNPSKAEELLQEAIRLSDGIRDRESHARLYELLAENKLNAGKVDEAERLRRQAETLRLEGPSDSQLWYRVLLRTGRIEEAQRQLETKAVEEHESPIQTPRAHRETLLLLSLIYAIQGDTEGALCTAVEGTQRGEQLTSPFVTAVGYMRQGHALMLAQDGIDYGEVQIKFEQAVEISRQLAIPRLRVEAFWGLCRAAGFQGFLDEAVSFANNGIEIANQAGDEWIASLIRLALGASFGLAGEHESAAEWLNQAVRGFEECSDPLGMAAARLWLSYSFYKRRDFEIFSQIFPLVLSASQKHRYDFLFIRQTLLGMPEVRVLVPMLLHARSSGWGAGYPEKLLSSMGLSELTAHPGYQLKVKTLGTFQAWRGAEAIPHDGWRRDKARQLFQVLITHSDSPLDRDQICELLWPDAEPEAAQRNFKVALNTLYGVLEPDRAAGSDSSYIFREGTVYGIRPYADILFDRYEFVERIKEAEKQPPESIDSIHQMLGKAIELYQGEYLPDARYESWAAEEREHLAVIFLRAADRYCEIGLEKQDYDQVIDVCGRILATDNCWERAYRHMMQAFDRLGDHGQVARTYQRCVETLRQEIDVAPADETVSLFNRLTQKIE
jgi:LuxR family maltose regulon positive regulatory protein